MTRPENLKPIITQVLEERREGVTTIWRVKTLEPGHHIEITEMLVNFRVQDVYERGGQCWPDRYWCYEGKSQIAFLAAVLAANRWDGAPDTEPVGWLKSWDGRYRGGLPL